MWRAKGLREDSPLSNSEFSEGEEKSRELSTKTEKTDVPFVFALGVKGEAASLGASGLSRAALVSLGVVRKMVSQQRRAAELVDSTTSKKPRTDLLGDGKSNQVKNQLRSSIKSIIDFDKKDDPNAHIIGIARKAEVSLGFGFHKIPQDWHKLQTPSRQ